MSQLTTLLAELEASKSRTEAAITIIKTMLTEHDRAQTTAAVAAGDLSWKNAAGKLTLAGVAYLEKRAGEGATAYALSREMDISYAAAERRLSRFKLAQQEAA